MKDLNKEIKAELEKEPGLVERLGKIFAKFKKEVPKKTEIKFEALPLKDGKELNYDGALEVGTQVMVMDAEGKPVPAPDGSYEAADGSIVKVTEGKVSEIVAAQPTPPVMDMESINAKFEKLEAKFGAQDKIIANLKKENSDLKKSLEESNDDLKNVSLAFERVVKMPAAEPVKGLDKPWSEMTNWERTQFTRR